MRSGEGISSLSIELSCVAPVPDDQTHQYGIVGVEDAKAKVSKITGMVEKPPQGTAPSNFFINGRYILQPEIFPILETQERGAGNEIQLTDGIARLLDHEFVLAHAFDGIRYDCGSKLGYLEATLAFGLNHPETGAEFRTLLKQYADKF